MHFYERLRYGVSHRDVWSFDHYLSDVICRGIEQLREGYGYPAHLDSFEQWVEILDEMHKGFYFHAHYWDRMLEDNFSWQKEQEVYDPMLERSLELFKEYYRHMWD